jgi:secreted Zn-dependent insulinase-like peptidase
MKNFYKTKYSSDKMYLVVIGNSEYKERLKSYILSTYSKINQNKNSQSYN